MERLAEAAPPPLEGEDLDTAHWEDARHWIGIYSDLLRFKLKMIVRFRRDLEQLGPEGRKAIAADLVALEEQKAGYETRLDLWYGRLWSLQGLWIDPDTRVIRHQGREVKLTGREFELLKFLLDHPHRFYSAPQIMGAAWGDAALFPEELRTYVRRLRKLLHALEIPVDLVNKPGRGYSLVFRDQK